MSESKVIVITGTTKGIGLALAEWFMGHGHSVIGCGRSHDAVERLNSTRTPNSLFSVVDIGDASSVEKWAKQSLEKFSPPDLLINNAGIANSPRKLWEVPIKEFDKMMDINLKGVNYVIHYFLPAMLEVKKGVVVNMSSGWGRHPCAEVAPYCCTKFGIEGLSLSLAKELPSPLTCVSLNPGMINTDMLENYFGDEAQHYSSTEQWVEKAGPFLLAINRTSNGTQMSIQ